MLAFNLKSLQCLRTGAFLDIQSHCIQKKYELFINVYKKGVCAIFESIHCKDDVHLLAKAMRCGSKRLLWKKYEAFTILVFNEMFSKLFYI